MSYFYLFIFSFLSIAFFQPINTRNLLFYTEIKEIEPIFESSVKKVQLIIHQLQNSTKFPNDKNYKGILFINEPESDTATMAQIIGHKLYLQGGRNCRLFLKSPLIISDKGTPLSHNEILMALQKTLNDIESSHKPTVLIIEELDTFIEYAQDREQNIDILSTFLDRQKNNRNFTFIGITTNVFKLPQFYQDEFVCKYIHVPSRNR